MKIEKRAYRKWLYSIMGAAFLLGALSSVGCTIHSNGMTIPSPDWLNQRVQYMPAGPQFPHSQERAMMDAAKAEKQSHQQQY